MSFWVMRRSFSWRSRAAWASLVVAALVTALWLTGRRYRAAWLLTAAALCAGGIFFRGEILGKTQAAVARDVSTLERLNRWSCALRMAHERPVTGFGPGTFQFQYLHFQQPEQMTHISATSPVSGHSPDTYGRGGGVHSEPMRALAETGWPGLVLVLVTSWVVMASFASPETRAKEDHGCRIFTRRSLRKPLTSHPSPLTLRSTLGFLMIVTAFCVHGAVNDLLHDTCVAAWVWGSLGVLHLRHTLLQEHDRSQLEK